MDIAEALANNYEQVHRTSNFRDPTTDTLVNQTLNLLEAEPNPPQIRNVRKLPNTKAPGQDQIQGRIVKKLLVDILNSSIRHLYFPTAWKNANVIPIKKANKDPHLATSYRPISLLSVFGKLYEKIILLRLQNTSINLIQNEQFGFRKNHSTCHQLTRIVNDISIKFTSRKPTTMILLDIEKAFDCVWHDGIIHKLRKLEVNNILVKIIKSYLNNRTFQVSLCRNTVTQTPYLSGRTTGEPTRTDTVHNLPP
ncbi:hypothetical protein M8J77_006662 [Diaphorina citri]|nr:hypothetical protein M8J77_006662 [Diaphorina citri]